MAFSIEQFTKKRWVIYCIATGDKAETRLFGYQDNEYDVLVAGNTVGMGLGVKMTGFILIVIPV